MSRRYWTIRWSLATVYLFFIATSLCSAILPGSLPTDVKLSSKTLKVNLTPIKQNDPPSHLSEHEASTSSSREVFSWVADLNDLSLSVEKFRRVDLLAAVSDQLTETINGLLVIRLSVWAEIKAQSQRNENPIVALVDLKRHFGNYISVDHFTDSNICDLIYQTTSIADGYHQIADLTLPWSLFSTDSHSVVTSDDHHPNFGNPWKKNNGQDITKRQIQLLLMAQPTDNSESSERIFNIRVSAVLLSHSEQTHSLSVPSQKLPLTRINNQLSSPSRIPPPEIKRENPQVTHRAVVSRPTRVDDNEDPEDDDDDNVYIPPPHMASSPNHRMLLHRHLLNEARPEFRILSQISRLPHQLSWKKNSPDVCNALGSSDSSILASDKLTTKYSEGGISTKISFETIPSIFQIPSPPSSSLFESKIPSTKSVHEVGPSVSCLFKTQPVDFFSSSSNYKSTSLIHFNGISSKHVEVLAARVRKSFKGSLPLWSFIQLPTTMFFSPDINQMFISLNSVHQIWEAASPSDSSSSKRFLILLFPSLNLKTNRNVSVSQLDMGSEDASILFPPSILQPDSHSLSFLHRRPVHSSPSRHYLTSLFLDVVGVSVLGMALVATTVGLSSAVVLILRKRESDIGTLFSRQKKKVKGLAFDSDGESEDGGSENLEDNNFETELKKRQTEKKNEGDNNNNNRGIAVDLSSMHTPNFGFSPSVSSFDTDAPSDSPLGKSSTSSPSNAVVPMLTSLASSTYQKFTRWIGSSDRLSSFQVPSSPLSSPPDSRKDNYALPDSAYSHYGSPMYQPVMPFESGVNESDSSILTPPQLMKAPPQRFNKHTGGVNNSLVPRQEYIQGGNMASVDNRFQTNKNSSFDINNPPGSHTSNYDPVPPPKVKFASDHDLQNSIYTSNGNGYSTQTTTNTGIQGGVHSPLRPALKFGVQHNQVVDVNKFSSNNNFAQNNNSPTYHIRSPSGNESIKFYQSPLAARANNQ